MALVLLEHVAVGVGWSFVNSVVDGVVIISVVVVDDVFIVVL